MRSRFTRQAGMRSNQKRENVIKIHIPQHNQECDQTRNAKNVIKIHIPQHNQECDQTRNAKMRSKAEKCENAIKVHTTSRNAIKSVKAREHVATTTRPTSVSGSSAQTNTSNTRDSEIINIGRDELSFSTRDGNIYHVSHYHFHSSPAAVTPSQSVNGSSSAGTRYRGSEEHLEDSESIVVTGSLVCEATVYLFTAPLQGRNRLHDLLIFDEIKMSHNDVQYAIQTKHPPSSTALENGRNHNLPVPGTLLPELLIICALLSCPHCRVATRHHRKRRRRRHLRVGHPRDGDGPPDALEEVRELGPLHAGNLTNGAGPEEIGLLADGARDVGRAHGVGEAVDGGGDGDPGAKVVMRRAAWVFGLVPWEKQWTLGGRAFSFRAGGKR
ncbi:hypothetical protein FIBSPDRAFT_994373 [Athelia psychrophila]|uniref:Uncharacterized protein n=1 Tax=Athelia psychrophila TaxID=1759441 RepID=A0A165XXU5_9AGAM|nr:hypothetical protein FIBSPDRAFT_994373 [Fibularhizoctonia sp. CBS 109695]